jgi:hypothetical protein
MHLKEVLILKNEIMKVKFIAAGTVTGSKH